MARKRLPTRRPNLTATAEWRDNAVHVTVGLDASGAVREVFARAQRSESEIDLVVDDVGVLLSLALQNDVTLAEVTHSMGRLPDGRPASVVALVADVALRVEAELRGPVLVAGGAP